MKRNFFLIIVFSALFLASQVSFAQQGSYFHLPFSSLGWKESVRLEGGNPAPFPGRLEQETGAYAGALFPHFRSSGHGSFSLVGLWGKLSGLPGFSSPELRFLLPFSFTTDFS
ncbi:MAG: hypothetical protein J7J32_05935 [Candidatus Atribacteria bacterium]|nr:hypothetical protein [Candidatus Atribacteria bacterium]MCD6349342.1 hypothetical protein [Candidatus Atribacteria bacterium]